MSGADASVMFALVLAGCLKKRNSDKTGRGRKKRKGWRYHSPRLLQETTFIGRFDMQKNDYVVILTDAPLIMLISMAISSSGFTRE